MIATRAIDLTSAGLERSAAMLRTAMPHAGHMTAELLAWQYVANPVGPALGLEAFDGDRLVSHCVVQPLVARLHGREVRGVMSMNAATLPEYLGRGVYFGLAAELYALARDAGYGFGVAVTNDMSTPGFVRHCGFQVVRPLDARLGVGPIPAARAAGVVAFEKVWSDEAMAWRLAPPHVGYRFEKHGDLTRVLGPSGKMGIEVMLGHLRGADHAKVAAARSRSTNPLRLWLGIDQSIDWRRSLYFDLPLRLRPSPLNLIFADLGGGGVRLDPREVRWSGLDFDDF